METVFQDQDNISQETKIFQASKLKQNRFLNILKSGFQILLVFTFFVSAESSSATKFSHRKDVQQFIHYVSQKHKIDRTFLVGLFSIYGTEPKIIQLMDKPSESLPWYRYQERLLSKERIKAGVLFWKKHEALLNRVEKQYGVPAEIIVAILGIETFYGQRQGTYPVLQSLATLAFDYPRRATFFRAELEQFLLLVKEENLDPLQTLGSYSGAIGAPQFMPSSYRRFAVDFEGKGQRNLSKNMADTLASIANYFKIHGWQPGDKVADRALVSGENYLPLQRASKDPKPNLTLQELANYNIRPAKVAYEKNKKLKAKFITLESPKNQIEPWLGFNNFYVITRYNHSTNYAMAVYQLSQRIRAELNNIK